MAEVRLKFTAHTKLAQAVMWALYPLYLLRLISDERVANIITRFVYVTTDKEN